MEFLVLVAELEQKLSGREELVLLCQNCSHCVG
jgi:hypothetical protein